MLKLLTIQNYALISHLEIDFPKGFSVITGETGAGKSIILGALSLILGQRADTKPIKRDEDKCLIEGVFDISSYQLEPFFTERDLEYDPDCCIMRREIWKSGKSRAFINDSPVGLADLKELGAFLIDVHSQHQNLLLGDNRFQLQVLDVLANNKELKFQYDSLFKEYSEMNRKLRELKDEINKKNSEEDYIRFQYQQLEEARLNLGELEELEEEQNMLSNVEEIKSGLFQIEHLLSSDNGGLVASLRNSLNTSRNLQKIYKPADEVSERIETAYIDLKDLAMEIASYQESLEFNPERLQSVHDRLDLIYSLQQKHRFDSVEELIELKDKLESQLREIDNFDEQLQKLAEKRDKTFKELLQKAEKLSKKRKQAAAILEKKLVEKVGLLGMPNMQFASPLTTKDHPDSSGMDEVRFLFSANKNGELKPVAQTASGGEISRLMLGVKSLIAGAMALPTVIFDEIDTGVSGEIADKMGKIMHQMGEVMQVITITHLPQIASQGEAQFFVYKDEDKDGVETHIRKLSEEERVMEIAQMLSGSELTEAAIKNAKELLKREQLK